ncbi:Splicing factor [Boothiomyces sp. JEL0866]|nr:Splicing factor [Boothiomyces sp. JEL0866]
MASPKSDQDYEMEYNVQVNGQKEEELRNMIVNNPYNYEAHMELLDLLQSDLPKLNAARKVFADIFNMPVDMWLEWISDLTVSTSDKQEVIKSYLNALDQQKRFFEFLAIEFEEGNITKDQALELMKSQLNAFALDFKDSHLLYDVYLDMINDNIDECRAEYLKRLETLHMEIDSTFSNYSAFESNLQDNYDQRMKSASSVVGKVKTLSRKREEFEIKVKNGEFADYLAYLDFEKKEGDIGRITRLYERTAELYYNDPYIWNSYVNYIFDKLATDEVEKIIYRGITSSIACMINCDLWICYLYLIEKKKGDFGEILQRAVYFTSGNFNDLNHILITRLAVGKRQKLPVKELQNLYKQLLEYKKSYDKENVKFEMERTMAKIYCLDYGETEQGYALFDKILKNNNDVEIWLEYGRTAIYAQDIDKARLVYRNSIRLYKKGIDLLYNAWIQFEEMFGTLDTIIKCRQLCFVAREKDLKHSEEAIQEEKRVLPEEKKNERKMKRELENDDELVEHKRFKPERKIDISQFKVIDSKNAGSMIYFGNLESHITDTDIISTFKRFGKIVDFYMMPNPENGALEAFLEYRDPQSVRDVISDGEFEIAGITLTPQRCRPAEMKWKFKNDEEKDTVYVSNLSSNIDKIILRRHFGYFGKIKDIRLQFKGKSAFAYVQYTKPEYAKESCKLDQTEIEKGREVSVAISNPLRKSFHEADEKVLYITNLSNSILEPDLENLFMPESAKKGLQLNGTRLDNRYITVSVADPNIRKKKAFAEPPKQKNTALLPRAVSRSHQKSVLKSQKSSINDTSEKDLKPKTQDDFRKMLFGNK